MPVPRGVLLRFHRGQAPAQGGVREADAGQGGGAGHGVRRGHVPATGDAEPEPAAAPAEGGQRVALQPAGRPIRHLQQPGPLHHLLGLPSLCTGPFGPGQDSQLRDISLEWATGKLYCTCRTILLC